MAMKMPIFNGSDDLVTIRNERRDQEDEPGSDFTHAREPQRARVIVAHQHFGNGCINSPQATASDGEKKTDEPVLVTDHSPLNHGRMRVGHPVTLRLFQLLQLIRLFRLPRLVRWMGIWGMHRLIGHRKIIPIIPDLKITGIMG